MDAVQSGRHETPSRRPWLALVGCMALFTMVGCAGSLPGSAAHHQLGSAVAPLRTPVLGGGAIASVPEPGKVTVAYFWSTTCEPCLASMPELDALYRQHAGAGLTIVGIAADENPGAVMELLGSLGVSFPIVVDGQHRQFFGKFHFGSEVPQTLVFDRSGRLRMYIQNKAAGYHSQLTDAVTELL